MHYIRKINADIFYLGASYHRLALFENLFPIPNGVSYNSYFIDDEKTCLLDTVDASVGEVFLSQLDQCLQERKLDYLIVNHLEPDHSSLISEIVNIYPEVTLVMTDKATEFLNQFLEKPLNCAILKVKEGDTLKLGKHELAFYMAPMVHWPEVMVTYDVYSHTLFSADAFGTFGALDGRIFADELNLDLQFYAEARRYYSNIVGKFGVSVQTLLRKAKSLDIEFICPLHGPIWHKNFSDFVNLYDLWSRYQPEVNEVMIAYGSMYDHTYNLCCELAARLADKGIKATLFDVSSIDVSYLISEVFRVKTIVLATPNYNGGIYPKMLNFIDDMEALNVKNKNFLLIENGTWAPLVNKKVKEKLSKLKLCEVASEELIIKTIYKDTNEEAFKPLLDRIEKLD